MRCPKCQSTMTEEHGLFTGETHWCFCRECGWSWDVKDEITPEQRRKIFAINGEIAAWFPGDRLEAAWRELREVPGEGPQGMRHRAGEREYIQGQ